MEKSAGTYLGLDFGTSTTLVARSRGASAAEVIPLGRSTEWLPSLIGIGTANDLVIGEGAELLPADHVIRSVKTAITRNQNVVHVPAGLGTFQADTVIEMIIRESLRRAGWHELGSKLAGVRAGCPAMWDRNQRLRLQSILASADVNVELADIIDEPIAAAIGWVNQRRLAHGEMVEGRLVVFDYGGGTLDIAICDVQWALNQPEITVLSCDGLAEAGDLLDQGLFDYVSERLSAAGAEDLNEQQKAAVLREVRLAKEALSTAQEVALRLEPFDLPSMTLTRGELEREFRQQLRQAINKTFSVLRLAKLREKNPLGTDDLRRLQSDQLSSSVDYVLLAGGMSQVPLVGEQLQELFHKARIERITSRERGPLRSPQHLIAGGLVFDPHDYDRLNLHCPSFNLRVEWQEPAGEFQGTTVYSSYTPLFTADQLATQSSLFGFSGQATIPVTSRAREGRLSVFGDDGERVALRIGAESRDWLPLAIRPGASVRVKLYVDGRIVVSVDGHQARFTTGEGPLRIERWQVIRGSQSRREVELSSDGETQWGFWGYPHK